LADAGFTGKRVNAFFQLTSKVAAASMRASAKGRFPWYDSNWLASYVEAKAIVAHHNPGQLSEFIAAFNPLRTQPDFETRKLAGVFGDAAMADIRETIRGLEFTRLELHEAQSFGRVIVHDHPVFTKLQQLVLPLVSETAGEDVEPLYNFLSLYSTLGVCPLHLDAPEAKWTLDVCIDGSEPWPIHISNAVSWPEEFEAGGGDDWQAAIKSSPAIRFNSHIMSPGEAILFSGSSQWHYRDTIAGANGKNFCNLLFLHYIPTGMRELIKPANWARLFGIRELDPVGRNYAEVITAVPNYPEPTSQP
jgi:hypothetical protein